MNILLSLINASDRAAVSESNFDRLDTSLAFMLRPSIDVTGTPTIDLGPPVAGDHVLDELWVDALGAIWKCTAAGTPGTWVQWQPAVVLTADLPVAPPDLYLVMIPDGPWTLKYWDNGTAAWVAV